MRGADGARATVDGRARREARSGRPVAGTDIGPNGGDVRRYERHWSPVHLDLVVDDLSDAIARAVEAGAVQEGRTIDEAYGRLAMFADPFGHGFCMIQFNEQGYDALMEPPEMP